MKVSLVQRSIEWLDFKKNWADAEKYIAECADSQVVVLPEMFSTGFCMEPEKSAVGGAETLGWMQEMAKKYSVNLLGSVAVEEDGAYYNRFYIVRPSGEFTKYDKRHLFTFAGEDKRYKAGNERVIVEVEGVRILLIVCYDLRFPVWIRNRGDYDLILCVANWPKSRRSAWDALLRARAIENLCYLGGVNIVGEDPSAVYSGGTAAINYIGATVANVEDNVKGIATFEVDMDALNAFRAKFPALNDADNFALEM